jgi:hypothetical protein
MKKLPFYLVSTIAAAAIVLLVVTRVKQSKFTLTTNSQRAGQDFNLGTDAAVNKTFAGFDYNKLLNKDTNAGTAEISLLQALINGYYGSPQPTVSISGTFNTATRNAVMDITGKQETSVYEFYYNYFAPMRGMEKGQAIIDSMTTAA